MSAIAVTGGAGFIGSHLCEALLKRGYKVINIDSFNDFYNPKFKSDNVKETKKLIKALEIDQDLYSLKEGDIRDLNFLEKVFKENRISALVHLAAYAGVRPSIENPVLYTDVNINGTVNLLECCNRYDVKKFIFASSSSVYGNNKKIPCSEEDIVDFPISPYAATKKAGELLCHTYHSLYGINTACLRFFTVYGPRQRPDLAIYKFTKLISQDQPVCIYGDGSTGRDYTYVEDTIDGIVKAVEWVNSGNNKYEIFNLGEAGIISLNKMVSVIEAALGKKAKINYLPMQPGDVNNTCANIEKAKRILGYNPQTDFEDGICRFVKWFEKAANEREV